MMKENWFVLKVKKLATLLLLIFVYLMILERIVLWGHMTGAEKILLAAAVFTDMTIAITTMLHVKINGMYAAQILRCNFIK
jgi:hypothetical protein